MEAGSFRWACIIPTYFLSCSRSRSFSLGAWWVRARGDKSLSPEQALYQGMSCAGAAHTLVQYLELTAGALGTIPGTYSRGTWYNTWNLQQGHLVQYLELTNDVFFHNLASGTTGRNLTLMYWAYTTEVTNPQGSFWYVLCTVQRMSLGLGRCFRFSSYVRIAVKTLLMHSVLHHNGICVRAYCIIWPTFCATLTTFGVKLLALHSNVSLLCTPAAPGSRAHLSSACCWLSLASCSPLSSPLAASSSETSCSRLTNRSDSWTSSCLGRQETVLTTTSGVRDQP